MTLTIQRYHLAGGLVIPNPSPGSTSFATGVSVPHDRLPSLFALAPDANWPAESISMESDFLAVTNTWRAQHGSQAVQLLGTLSQAAGYGGRFLANYDLLAHDYPPTPDGHPALSAADRIAQMGYAGAWGENAAYGFLTAQAALDAFASEGPNGGHYENLINPAWNAIGVGVAQDKGGLWFYVQDFGIMPFHGSKPAISSMTPDHGNAGDDISLLGSNFNSPVTVVFIGSGSGNKQAAVKSLTPQTIVATVPVGAETGLVAVTAQGGYAVAPGQFTVGSTPTPTKPPINSRWKKPAGKMILQVDSIATKKGIMRVYMHRVDNGAKTSAPLATFFQTYNRVA